MNGWFIVCISLLLGAVAADVDPISQGQSNLGENLGAFILTTVLQEFPYTSCFADRTVLDQTPVSEWLDVIAESAPRRIQGCREFGMLPEPIQENDVRDDMRLAVGAAVNGLRAVFNEQNSTAWINAFGKLFVGPLATFMEKKKTPPFDVAVPPKTLREHLHAHRESTWTLCDNSMMHYTICGRLVSLGEVALAEELCGRKE